MMLKKIYISWEEFQAETKRLCDKIRKKGTFDKIIAISRGGLIPACIAAYELDIRNCHTINVMSYDGDKGREDKDIKVSVLLKDLDEKTLVIDDLADTGRTFEVLKKKFPKATYAAVYSKPAGEKSADLFACSMPDNWIVFPWD